MINNTFPVNFITDNELNELISSCQGSNATTYCVLLGVNNQFDIHETIDLKIMNLGKLALVYWKEVFSLKSAHNITDASSAFSNEEIAEEFGLHKTISERELHVQDRNHKKSEREVIEDEKKKKLQPEPENTTR